MFFFFNFDFSGKTNGPGEAELWDLKYGVEKGAELVPVEDLQWAWCS